MSDRHLTKSILSLRIDSRNTGLMPMILRGFVWVVGIALSYGLRRVTASGYSRTIQVPMNG
jgi:hypothetical protein